MVGLWMAKSVAAQGARWSGMATERANAKAWCWGLTRGVGLGEEEFIGGEVELDGANEECR